jgi:hypothetical protein
MSWNPAAWMSASNWEPIMPTFTFPVGGIWGDIITAENVSLRLLGIFRIVPSTFAGHCHSRLGKHLEWLVKSPEGTRRVRLLAIDIGLR